MNTLAKTLFWVAGLTTAGAIAVRLVAPRREVSFESIFEDPSLLLPDRWEIATFALGLLAALSLITGFIVTSRRRTEGAPAPASERSVSRGLGQLGPWLMIVFGALIAVVGPLLTMREEREIRNYLDGPNASEFTEFFYEGFEWSFVVARVEYAVIGIFLLVFGAVLLRRSHRNTSSSRSE